MNMRIFGPLPTLAVLGVLACDDALLDPNNTDQVVIEAFLYAGEPVTDIHVRGTVALGQDPDSAEVVDDAVVRLIKGGVVYPLTNIPDSGRYEYRGTGLTVSQGDVFQLEVDYLGQTATGETVVPAPPVGVALDNDTLFAPNINLGGGGGRPGGGGGTNFNRQAEATWDNPDALWHFVVIEGLEDSTEQILPDQILNRLRRRFRFVSQPTIDPFYNFNILALENLGRHLIRVYRVNEEYRDLYENRTQDSRDLNEPPSNIRHGIGIFSAFNSVTQLFVVVRDPIP